MESVKDLDFLVKFFSVVNIFLRMLGRDFRNRVWKFWAVIT